MYICFRLINSQHRIFHDININNVNYMDKKMDCAKGLVHKNSIQGPLL